jgi:hypothetical protein
LAETDFREGDAETKTGLTYSTTDGISRARPALGALVVCIIQVTPVANVPDAWSILPLSLFSKDLVMKNFLALNASNRSAPLYRWRSERAG